MISMLASAFVFDILEELYQELAKILKLFVFRC